MTAMRIYYCSRCEFSCQSDAMIPAWGGGDDLELCPDCMRELQKWLLNGRVAGKSRRTALAERKAAVT